VENPLAQEILSGKFGPKDTIVVDVGGGEIVFRKKSDGEKRSAAR
jgi:ATP-dependent Clp protease ATP-binding subunit ClpB